MSPDVVEAIDGVWWLVFSGITLASLVGISMLKYLSDIRDELKRLADDRESGKEKL